MPRRKKEPEVLTPEQERRRQHVHEFAAAFDSLPEEYYHGFRAIARRVLQGKVRAAAWTTPEDLALASFSLGFVLGAALAPLALEERSQDDQGASSPPPPGDVQAPPSAPWGPLSWTS